MPQSLRGRYLRRIKPVSVLVFLLFLAGACLAETPQLEFSISLDKGEYKTQEPITATFKLENRGKEPVWVNKRFYLNSETVEEAHRGEVVLQVTSPSGEALSCKFSYGASLPKSDYFELLEPGKAVVSEYPRNLRGYFDFDESGIYGVVAVYQNILGQEIGLDVFGEKLSSEPVSIKIIKE